MPGRLAGAAAVVLGVAIGAALGLVTVRRAPTTFTARAVVQDVPYARRTSRVDAAARILTGRAEPFVGARVSARPGRVVVSYSDASPIAAIASANGVAIAYAWTAVAPAWARGRALELGPPRLGVHPWKWVAGAPLLVSPPETAAVGARGLGFSCAGPGCGVWIRVFVPFSARRTYRVSAVVDVHGAPARLALGVAGDAALSRVDDAGKERLIVRWRPSMRHPWAEVAVRAAGRGAYEVSHVEIVAARRSSLPPRRAPRGTLAVAAEGRYAPAGLGAGVGALGGGLIVAGGLGSAYLARRTRDSKRERDEQPRS